MTITGTTTKLSKEALSQDLFVKQGNGYRDIVDWTIYDRIHIPANTPISKLYFFLTPLGRNCDISGQLKTIADTNMEFVGMLPAPNSMLVKQITIHANDLINPEDLNRLQKYYSWHFQIGQKMYAEAPMLVTGPNVGEDELYKYYVGSVNGLEILCQQYFKFLICANDDNGWGYHASMQKFDKEFDLCVCLKGVLSRSIS